MTTPQATPENSAKIMAVLHRMRTDFEFYARTVLRVQTTRGQIIPFTLNRPQKILHGIVETIRKERPVRIVALKARRMGFSTYFSGRYYQKTSWHHNRYAAQITHEPEATDALFKMVKRFYDFSPADFRPATRYNNTRLLEFNTKDGQGLNSGFRVATAGKEDFGSGQLLHYVHLSEVTKWQSGTAESLLTSILQCVPDGEESEVVFESTAKGIGGEFYDRFWSARYRVWVVKQDDSGNPIVEYQVNTTADENDMYTAVFLPWFAFDEYQTPTPEEFSLDLEENKLKKQYNLTDAQMYWRRITIANKCNKSVEKFQQEYPATPEEAFLGTGRPVFDNVKLQFVAASLLEPIVRYDCLTGIGQWTARSDGRLSVWEEPKPGRAYIIGVDVAEGLGKGDYSSADVLDHLTGKQVAHWHGHIDPDEFAQVLIALGKRYNGAWLGIERNNHGLTVVTWVCNARYPHVYAEMVPDPPGKPRKRYGWVTSRATRPLIIDNLIREVRDDTHFIMSRETIGEMLSFKIQDNGRYEADEGRKDDRVLSFAIAKYLRQVIALPSARLNVTDDIAEHYHTIARKGCKDKRGWT